MSYTPRGSLHGGTVPLDPGSPTHHDEFDPLRMSQDVLLLDYNNIRAFLKNADYEGMSDEPPAPDGQGTGNTTGGHRALSYKSAGEAKYYPWFPFPNLSYDQREVIQDPYKCQEYADRIFLGTRDYMHGLIHTGKIEELRLAIECFIRSQQNPNLPQPTITLPATFLSNSSNTSTVPDVTPPNYHVVNPIVLPFDSRFIVATPEEQAELSRAVLTKATSLPKSKAILTDGPSCATTSILSLAIAVGNGDAINLLIGYYFQHSQQFSRPTWFDAVLIIELQAAGYYDLAFQIITYFDLVRFSLLPNGIELCYPHSYQDQTVELYKQLADVMGDVFESEDTKRSRLGPIFADYFNTWGHLPFAPRRLAPLRIVPQPIEVDLEKENLNNKDLQQTTTTTATPAKSTKKDDKNKKEKKDTKDKDRKGDDKDKEIDNDIEKDKKENFVVENNTNNNNNNNTNNNTNQPKKEKEERLMTRVDVIGGESFFNACVNPSTTLRTLRQIASLGYLNMAVHLSKKYKLAPPSILDSGNALQILANFAIPKSLSSEAHHEMRGVISSVLAVLSHHNHSSLDFAGILGLMIGLKAKEVIELGLSQKAPALPEPSPLRSLHVVTSLVYQYTKRITYRDLKIFGEIEDASGFVMWLLPLWFVCRQQQQQLMSWADLAVLENNSSALTTIPTFNDKLSNTNTNATNGMMLSNSPTGASQISTNQQEREQIYKMFQKGSYNTPYWQVPSTIVMQWLQSSETELNQLDDNATIQQVTTVLEKSFFGLSPSLLPNSTSGSLLLTSTNTNNNNIINNNTNNNNYSINSSMSNTYSSNNNNNLSTQLLSNNITNLPSSPTSTTTTTTTSHKPTTHDSYQLSAKERQREQYNNQQLYFKSLNFTPGVLLSRPEMISDLIISADWKDNTDNPILLLPHIHKFIPRSAFGVLNKAFAKTNWEGFKTIEFLPTLGENKHGCDLLHELFPAPRDKQIGFGPLTTMLHIVQPKEHDLMFFIANMWRVAKGIHVVDQTTFELGDIPPQVGRLIRRELDNALSHKQTLFEVAVDMVASFGEIEAFFALCCTLLSMFCPPKDFEVYAQTIDDVAPLLTLTYTALLCSYWHTDAPPSVLNCAGDGILNNPDNFTTKTISCKEDYLKIQTELVTYAQTTTSILDLHPKKVRKACPMFNKAIQEPDAEYSSCKADLMKIFTYMIPLDCDDARVFYWD